LKLSLICPLDPLKKPLDPTSSNPAICEKPTKQKNLPPRL
jgi:hypothetical protein